jgi:hypothetical protein
VREIAGRLFDRLWTGQGISKADFGGVALEFAREAYAAGRASAFEEAKGIARAQAREAEIENESVKPDDPMAGVSRDELRSLHRYMASDDIADAIAARAKEPG